MVSRRHRARFFSKAAPLGFSPLTLRRRKAPPLRYVLLILLTLGAISGWSFGGAQFMAVLNPALRTQLHLMTPALDAWITPPDYTGASPIMIATPAGTRYRNEVIEVPEDSMVTAHLGDSDGAAPDLFVNGEKTAFGVDKNGDFEIAQPVKNGDTISIRRGWEDIADWKIKVIPDRPPQVTLTEPPSITERKTVRLSYEASDDYAVASIVARITPRESLPRSGNEPVEIRLASPNAKTIHRVSFEDFTSYAWAGQPVQIQLIVTDAGGHQAQTAPVDFTLPVREFTNPIARALIEERARLAKSPEDENIRNEVANVMAGIAHVPATYHDDPVVLMSLRSGAVRLVLNQGAGVNGSVNELIWEAATRIEDGAIGIAERHLRETQGELADALDQRAAGPEIQGLVDRLHDALTAYLAALSTRVAHPSPEDLNQAFASSGGVPAANDMDHMLLKIRDLSMSGKPDAAREELLQLEQKLENFRTNGSSFSDEMKKRAGSATHPEGARSSIQRLMQNF